MMKHAAWLTWGVVCVLSLAGCDQIKERAGIQDPTKVEAEGKAIGSACRHAGWGIEDCFRLNPGASKPAMFAGWKDMNEYMLKNNMEAVAPTISSDGQTITSLKGKQKTEAEPTDMTKVGEADQAGVKSAEKPAEKTSGHDAKAGPQNSQKKEPPAH